MKVLEMTLEHLLGIEIDYYVLVDMAGFVDLVDAVGGVEVLVTDPLQAEVSPPTEGGEWVSVDVQPGLNRLSGAEALAYVRARKGSTDYVRMERQRCLLRSAAADVDALGVFRAFPAILAAVQESTTTNIPLSLLPDLVRLGAELDLDRISTVGFVPPYYAPTWNPKGPVPDVDRIRAKVRKVLAEGTVGQSSSGDSECG